MFLLKPKKHGSQNFTLGDIVADIISFTQ